MRHDLAFDGTMTEAGEHRFVLELAPELCGRLDYRIRAYPCIAALTHPFELGLMVWGLVRGGVPVAPAATLSGGPF